MKTDLTEGALRPSFLGNSHFSEPKLNAFGMPVDDMIEIGDILKVSVLENSSKPPMEQVILQNIKVPEMMNKREPFSLEKLSKLNNSLTAAPKVEESAYLGKRDSVLQENEAPGRPILPSTKACEANQVIGDL
jgi:hypothetical protein